jgi:hypothetical protein
MSARRALIHVRNHREPWFTASSLSDLRDRDQDIRDRIHETLNGGLLFITNPLRLLEDLGIELSDQARQELLDFDPRLGLMSSSGYQALMEKESAQPVQVEIRPGLFREDEKK